jgi:hypothetical protein
MVDLEASWKLAANEMSILFAALGSGVLCISQVHMPSGLYAERSEKKKISNSASREHGV